MDSDISVNNMDMATLINQLGPGSVAIQHDSNEYLIHFFLTIKADDPICPFPRPFYAKTPARA